MIKLYLVRHGETEANQQGVYYGRHDVPLTEKGILQSQRLAKKLVNESFECIIISSLQRTRQTAELFDVDSDTEMKVFSEFDELDFGDWEGKHYQELIKNDNEHYAAWCNDWINQAPPNGESFRQFMSRIEYGLNNLLASQPDGSILFVGHQGVLRVIMLILLKMPEEAFWHFTFKHGAYSLIEIEQGHAVVQKINAD